MKEKGEMKKERRGGGRRRQGVGKKEGEKERGKKEGKFT